MNSGFLSDYDYTKLIFTATNNRKIKQTSFLEVELFSNLENGSNWAPESKTIFIRIKSENMMNNKFTRSKRIYKFRIFRIW